MCFYVKDVVVQFLDDIESDYFVDGEFDLIEYFVGLVFIVVIVEMLGVDMVC